MCLAVVSCGDSQEKKNLSVQGENDTGSPVDNTETQGTGIFYISQYNETIPASNDKQKSDAAMEISLSLIDTEQADLVKLIRSTLYNGRSAKEYANEVINDSKKEYQEETAAADPEQWADDMAWTLSWSYEEKHDVNVRGSYAVISRSVYSYTGGAHPNGTMTYLVIDMNKPEKLLINDIVQKASSSRLNSIVERELRAYSESVEDEPLPSNVPLSEGIFFEDDFEIADYYPAGDGLHFYWDPYDLAAYAFGPIEVSISWKELEGLLSPKGVKMADAFRN